jgi:TDG/mug DNA glycosylase family protein
LRERGRRATQVIYLYGPYMVLPDVVQPGLRIIFCGTAVGDRSALVGAYYAGRDNQFWPVIQRVGLTSQRLAPSEYATLLEYGIGLTDLCKVASGPDRAVGTQGFDVPRLKVLLKRMQPATVAFNGKKAAEVVLERSADYGRQPERIAGAVVFVLPSTSGRASKYWNKEHWRALAETTGVRR